MAPRVCRRAASLKVWAAARLGGELRHLLDARGMEVTALAMLLPQEAGVLVAVASGARGWVAEEFAQYHGSSCSWGLVASAFVSDDCIEVEHPRLHFWISVEDVPRGLHYYVELVGIGG